MTNNVTPILQETDFYIPNGELKEIFQEVRIQMNHESYVDTCNEWIHFRKEFYKLWNS